ncbi:hypothetical protein [Xanthomarina gelatinilytica]|uniref:hypothetical protein n=1 Tax=Xanthomarina gelatinilytica TaxID=1137281 RepID=UPI003AA96757
MIKKTLTILTALITLVACKETESKPDNAKSKKELVVTEKKEESKKLVVELDIETDQPEDLVLYSNEIFLNNGQFMNLRITQKLNSNETKKHVAFEFPDNVKPDYNLGLLLGRKNEKELKITNLQLTFGSFKLSIPENEFDKYFVFNKFVDYQKDTNTIVVKKVGGKLNPTISLKRKYLNQIGKE